MSNLNETAKLVVEWAADRNLLEGTNSQRQFLKVVEEAGEIDTALLNLMKAQMEGGETAANDAVDELKDAIGDTIVTVIILAEQSGLSSATMLDEATKRLEQNNPVETILSGLGKIANAVARGKSPDVVESILTEFTYTILRYTKEFNLFTVEDALLSAYNVIKDRKGRMINGIFVKEEDLPENQAV